MLHVVSHALLQVVTGVAVQPDEQESASWTLQSTPPLHAAMQSAPIWREQLSMSVVMSARAGDDSVRAKPTAAAPRSK